MIIKAPKKYHFGFKDWRLPSVFLAGSIEMGKAVDWQTEFSRMLEKIDPGIVVFNPRRDDWDSSWKQDINNPQFNEQVTWELDMMERCDVIVMYLAPGTISPISLLELGLNAHTGKLIVCCPEGFERKGNVDIVCKREGIEQVNTLSELLEAVIEHLEIGDYL